MFISNKKHIYQNINRMNKSIKEKKECIFKTNSNLENNSNRIPTTINKRNDYNNIEENFFLLDKSANIFGNEIDKNCKINEEYFSFLERNIEDPNKTEKNYEL